MNQRCTQQRKSLPSQWQPIYQKTERSGLIKAFLLVTALILTALLPNTTSVHINNSTQEHVAQQVTEIVTPTEAVDPIPQPEIVVENVQEQTPNQAEANVTLNPVGCTNYRHLVEQYDWNVSVAMAVMQAESGCNPEASNWNDRHATCIGSFGLFQLGCFWTDNPHDPATNVAKAYEIYSRSGWRPWGAFNNKSYLRYL